MHKCRLSISAVNSIESDLNFTCRTTILNWKQSLHANKHNLSSSIWTTAVQTGGGRKSRLLILSAFEASFVFIKLVLCF